jgi:bifunctional DNase/RNase
VDGVFIARLVTGSGQVVDARPGDALNLALVLDVPIHTVPRVLELSRERLDREPVPGGDGHQTLAAEATATLAASVIDP